MSVATVEQVWQLYDAMPEHLRVAVLLGAFAGLRVAEVSGLRLEDVDFFRAVVFPKQQFRGQPLKTDGSSAPIPVPRDLVLMLSKSVQQFPGSTLVTNGHGEPVGPWVIQRAIAAVKDEIDGLPDEFTFHDLRHFYASLLISAGEDIKTVQTRMRHASARTTLDTYAHMFPSADDSTRSAIGAAITQRQAKQAETS